MTVTEMTPEAAAALREPFPPSAVGSLPKGGTTLDYVGHAAVTDRLLKVDPEWSWEPLALAPDGGPLVRLVNKDAEMWIRLTVCGHSRIGVGIVNSASFELGKQLVSDAIRNAAMRFGVALDLWAKEDLHDIQNPPATIPAATSKQRDDIAAALAALDGAAATSVKAWWKGQTLPKADQLNTAQAETVLTYLAERAF